MLIPASLAFGVQGLWFFALLVSLFHFVILSAAKDPSYTSLFFGIQGSGEKEPGEKETWGKGDLGKRGLGEKGIRGKGDAGKRGLEKVESGEWKKDSLFHNFEFTNQRIPN